VEVLFEYIKEICHKNQLEINEGPIPYYHKGGYVKGDNSRIIDIDLKKEPPKPFQVIVIIKSSKSDLTIKAYFKVCKQFTRVSVVKK